MEKSEVSYSRNIDQEKKQLLQMKLSFKAVEEHEKYLGLPTYVGSSKKVIFQSIQERVLKKLKGWKEGFLSQGGREVLIKAIAQAIPTYAMQCFSIPVSILNEIERWCRNFFWGQRNNERKTAWVAWDRMYASKRDGGLGMRNLQVFNKAMLAKQAWRILTNTNSLMSKTLKNKYFPNSSLIDVRVSPAASFTWKSILSSRDLLMKGTVKVVGDGKTIAIWNDPWIPELPNSSVLPRVNQNEDSPSFVNELRNVNGWNREILGVYFNEWEREAILKIPLPMYPCEDQWAWKLTKHGDFSVRSAYFAELKARRDEKASNSNSANHKIWAKLWGAKIPPKIRHFGWRVLHGGVPVLVNLKKRGLKECAICPVCGEHEETLFHALFQCCDARLVWRLSPLRLEVEDSYNNSIGAWCDQLLEAIKDEEWWVLFWSILWGIWLKRNAWIFERRIMDPQMIVRKAIGLVGEYEKATEKNKFCLHNNPPLNRVWKAPVMGTYKTNVDAAIFQDDCIGLGCVVRDFEGDVMAAMCNKIQGHFAVDVAEAMAVRFGISTAMEAGLRNLIIETDNLKVYTHLKKGKRETSSFGSIISDIFHLASQCNAISFMHVCRTGNKVAHNLAQLSRKYEEMRVWLEETPTEVVSDVIADLSGLE